MEGTRLRARLCTRRPTQVCRSCHSPTAWRCWHVESADVASDPVAAYLRARAVSETFKAKTAQLEYEERGQTDSGYQAGEYAAHCRDRR